MYNMDVSIFGYKIGLEILILICVIYLILVGHTICGCCNFYSLIEGMDGSGNYMNGSGMDGSGNPVAFPIRCTKGKTDNMIQCTDACGNVINYNRDTKPGDVSTTTGKKEGFTGANINYGESSLYSLKNSTPLDTSSWSAQNMTVVPGKRVSAGVKAFLARPEQPIPLPEGEMLLFANTKFAPEYCPNTYSTSTGCAAMTGAQYNYLITRGGNNVPYSEY